MKKGNKVLFSLLLTFLICLTNIIGSLPTKVDAATKCDHYAVYNVVTTKVDAHTTKTIRTGICNRCGAFLSQNISDYTTPHDWYVASSYVKNGVTHFVIICSICGKNEIR